MFDSYAYSFRFIDLAKILIILINDSNESNHSSKFTVLFVVVFKKQKKKQKDRQQVKQTLNFLLSTIVFVRYHIYFVLRVYVESWRIEVNNIMCIVKYEYDEYFKL